MGYELHITRRKYWCDDGSDITASEWIRYLESDPELHFMPESGKNFAQWSGHCRYSDPWFDWWEGCIYTKNPDEAMLAKMLQIASALSARVQGDDGEIYHTANFEDFDHKD